MAEIVDHVGFEQADAGELGELLDRFRRAGRAAGIGGEQDRIARRQQRIRELVDQARIDAGRLGRAVAFAGIGAHVVVGPDLGEDFARQHQVDRPLRVALHDRVGAADDFLGDDAGRQRPFPFGVGPHQAALVERLLHEVHVVVARAGQLAVGGERRLARHQQHRQPAAIEVVHGVRGVGGADVDMHQHALAAAGHQRVAAGHVRRGVLVRAHDDGRDLLAAPLAAGKRLDDRGVVGAHVREQVVDPDLVQAFDQIVRGRMARDIGAGIHGDSCG